MAQVIEKSIPYTADDFDKVADQVYNKWHNIRYDVEKVEIRDGQIFFTIDGKEYNSQEFYNNFDERYRSFDLGGEYYYLPAGMREQSIYTTQIEQKEREINKVCPICGGKNISSSEEPRDITLDFSSDTPGGIFIKCNDCGFSLHNGSRIHDGREKFEVFSDFVNRWNTIKIVEKKNEN